jgi:hypothetical protein
LACAARLGAVGAGAVVIAYEVVVPVSGHVGDEALDRINQVAAVSLLISFEEVEDPYDLAVTIAELNRDLASMGVAIEIGKPRRVRRR